MLAKSPPRGPAHRADPAETALAVLADMEVAGETRPHDFSAAFLARAGAPSGLPEAVAYVVARGLRDVMRDKRAYERLRLKVMALDPEHYTRLAEAAQGRADADVALVAADPASLTRPEKARRSRLVAAQAAAEERRAARAEEDRAMAGRAQGFFQQMEAAWRFYSAWTLSTGKPLGEATRADLLAEAAREDAQAEGHRRNVTFYTQLAGRMPDEGTVREHVALDEAHRIREAAFLPADSSAP